MTVNQRCSIDARTLRLAQLGDRELTQNILEQLRPCLRKIVSEIAGGRFRSQVEDITQDVLLKLLRNLPSFEAERAAKFPSWSFALARNHCLDLLRKKRLAVASLDEQRWNSSSEPLSASPGPLARVMRSERMTAILWAARQLSPKLKQAFVQRDLKGLSYAEIASRFDVHEETVKTRVSRARRALRQRLEVTWA
jgi:RNA polymerase sigma-70 factor (ECF subfamily)